MKNQKKPPVLDDRISRIYHLAQPGLMYMPTNGIFLTIQLNLTGKAAKNEILDAICTLTKAAGRMKTVSRIVAGFSSSLWKKWTN